MAKAAFSKNKKTLLQQLGLKSKDEISGVLLLEHSFVWCWEVRTSKIRSEIPEKLCDVVPGEEREKSVTPMMWER